MKSAYMGFIPANVRYDNNLSARDKVIYSEITATIDGDKCIKGNAYFEKIFNISSTTLGNCLRSLRENGYIEVHVEKAKNSHKVLNRYIYLPCTNKRVGVKQESETPSTQNMIGVNYRSEGDLSNKDENQSQNRATSYSNKITYINSDKYTKNRVELLPEINSKQINYLNDIVRKFYAKKRSQIPNVIHSEWDKDSTLINDSINTLYMIIKLDDYSEKVVKDVLIWAVDDKFWYTNLTSLRGLRKKSNNSHTKFTNIYLKYKQGER